MTTMVVTGATSGIGRSIAFEFAARQAGAEACLILCYRSDALEADSMAKSLSGEFGCFVKSISADLSTREGLNDLLRYLGDERVDYLSYNVGMGIYRPFSEITLDEWDRVMFANLTAPVFLVQGLMGSFSQGGSVLLNGSCSGVSPHSTCVAYGVSKAALHYAARSLVKELEPLSVRVNAIAPGFIDTPRNDSRSLENRKRIEGKIAAHRFGRPEEIAKAALDILENTYINGSVIEVDGGYEYF